MTERTFTAAEMLEQARLTQVFAEWALSHWYPGAPVSVDEANGLKLSAAMLRQGADAESRWEQLKAWLIERRAELQEWAKDEPRGFTREAYVAQLDEVKSQIAEMAHLEQERTA